MDKLQLRIAVDDAERIVDTLASVVEDMEDQDYARDLQQIETWLRYLLARHAQRQARKPAA